MNNINRFNQVWFWERLLTIISASALPLYLSIFRYNVGNVIVRIADIFVIILLVSGFVFFQSARLRVFSKTLIPIYILALVIIIHGLWYENIEASIKQSVQLLYVSLFLNISSFFIKRNPHLFMKWFVRFLIISSLYTIFYHFSIGEFVRFKMAYDGKYAFGLLSTILFLICIKDGWRNPFPLLLGLSIIPLLLSLERKGVYAFLMVVFIWGGMKLVTTLKLGLKFTVLIIFIMISLAVSIFLPEIIEFLQLKSHQNLYIDEAVAIWSSNTHRQSLLINGWDIFLGSPVFGIGADKTKEAMLNYYANPFLSNGVHNYYLDTLIVYGVVGLSLLITSVAIGIRQGLSQLENKKPYILFIFYSAFVVSFMSDGQVVIIMFMLPAYIAPIFLPAKQCDLKN